MKLLIATRNAHKLEEIKAIFSQPSLDLVSLNDYPDLPPVIEDGTTFIANAIKKAVTPANVLRIWALADDSGLEVDALDGAPGVRSARYAGEPVDYEANNAKLLRELKGVTNRKARFHCTIGLSSPSGCCQVVEGQCEGSITDAPRGSNGFGYDPVFVPEGHSMSFAEMESEEKNRISHRAVALSLVAEKWKDLLAGRPDDWPNRN